MRSSVNLKAKGLHTFENPLSVPEGALLVAKNVVVDRPETTETRRGFKQYGDVLGAAGKAMSSFQGHLIVHNGTTLSYDSDLAGTWANYTGTYAAPSDYRMKFAESNKNIYFTTSNGVYKLDAYNGTPTLAGAPKGLNGTGSTTGSVGWMPDSANVAYRVTWAYEDANDNFIEGAPSQRIVVSNTSGGTRDVALTFLIPDEVTTSYIYRVYRSPSTPDLTTEPLDDMQLVLEYNPTAGEITAEEVTITDSTPDSLKGDALYTGSNQQGIANANDRPPLAQDIALFKGNMLYLNTSTLQNLLITLQTRLTNGDTVTIAGEVYTAASAEDPGAQEFKAATGGTLADDIEETALSLVSVINQTVSDVYAYYVSGYNDLPGQVEIEARTLGVSVFTAASSNGSAWSPDLTAAVSSSNENNPSYLYVSKNGEPEAVPWKNFLPIGSANKSAFRIIPLRDTALIYKEDGIFSITGNTVDDFQVLPFDNTVRLLAPDTATEFNNAAYSYTDQGIVATSNSEGSPIMSRAIERAIVELSSDLYPFFPTASWAVGYESDRKYILAVPSSEESETAQQMYVFNALTNAWTLWDLASSHGIINAADGKFYFVRGEQVYQERKTFTRLDYADEEIALTISGVSGVTVTVTDTTGVEAGDTLFQDNGANGVSAVIESVDDSTTLTVDEETSFAAGDALALTPIDTDVEWAPITLGSPGVLKHFQEILLPFRTIDFDGLDLSFTTDLTSQVSQTVVAPRPSASWNTGGWSTYGWNGGTRLPQGIRAYIPLESRRARWISPRIMTSQALTSFASTGVVLFGEWVSPRSK